MLHVLLTPDSNMQINKTSKWENIFLQDWGPPTNSGPPDGLKRMQESSQNTNKSTVLPSITSLPTDHIFMMQMLIINIVYLNDSMFEAFASIFNPNRSQHPETH